LFEEDLEKIVRDGEATAAVNSKHRQMIEAKNDAMAMDAPRRHNQVNGGIRKVPDVLVTSPALSVLHRPLSSQTGRMTGFALVATSYRQ